MTLTLRRKTLVVRTLVAAIGASFVSGCAVDPATGKPSFKETFASDDPCSQNARNIGIGVGVLAGALLGRQVGGDNKGLLVGAALGGVIGGLIGNDMDKRRCELSKIAKQYQLDLQITALDNKGEAITTTDSAKAKQETAGSVVEIRDPAGAGGHFESNSDQLTARARDYFTAIAATYDIRKSAAEIQDPNLRKQYLEKMSQRKLLLVGHTDDTGSSRLNADLSERRARAVVLRAGGRTRAATSAKNNTARTTRSADVVAKDNRNDGKGDAAATAPAPKTSASAPAANAPASASTRKAALPDSGDWIDFGGTPLIASSDTAAIGKVEGKRPFFSLISPAYADEPPVLADCTRDRPRAANGVKSLADGKAYRTSEHIPGLYGKTWTEQVNGHQVVINRIAVLAGDGTLANLPEFKVYKNYDAARRTSAKPDVQLQPEVNTYLGSKGLLYRIFLKGQGGMQCADIVFDAGGGSAARAGRLVYLRANTPYAADFKPRMYQ